MDTTKPFNYYEFERFIVVNSVTKIYPNFCYFYKYKNPYIQKLEGFEEHVSNTKIVSRYKVPDYKENFNRSVRRTKTITSDLVLSNVFDSFATFTFSEDRHNEDLKRVQMFNWLKNQKRLHGQFKYLINPEYHKDGAIHFHALFHNYPGRVTFSGRTKQGNKIYNIDSYKLGFSTLSYINDIEKVSSYVRKHITKSMPILENKKRYWCSKGLHRPRVILNFDFSHLDIVENFDNSLYTKYRFEGKI